MNHCRNPQHRGSNRFRHRNALPKSSVLAFLVYLLFLATEAHAYTFLTDPPVVWPPGQVIMEVHISEPSTPFIDGNTSYLAVIQEAMAAWNPYLGGVQLVAVPNSATSVVSGDRMNQIFFSSSVYGMAFP